MALLLLLGCAAICVVVFKLLRIPVNKWTVTTAAVGGAVVVDCLLLHGGVKRCMRLGAEGAFRRAVPRDELARYAKRGRRRSKFKAVNNRDKKSKAEWRARFEAVVARYFARFDTPTDGSRQRRVLPRRSTLRSSWQSSRARWNKLSAYKGRSRLT